MTKAFTSTASSRLFASLALAALAGAASAAQTGLAPFNLVGNATRVGTSVQLTPPAANQVGAAWLNRPVDVTRSFEVRFSFSLSNGTFPQADGIAFAIQANGPAAIGGGGGSLGFEGLQGAGSVVQTYTNNHVGITIDANPADAKPAPAQLGFAGDIEGWEVVAYDAFNHVLKMHGELTLDGTTYQVADGRQVDLTAVLGADTGTIGMTGGSGDNFADQRVTAFSFKYLP